MNNIKRISKNFLRDKERDLEYLSFVAKWPAFDDLLDEGAVVETEKHKYIDSVSLNYLGIVPWSCSDT